MRDEVRNLLLVASELGGQVSQYVKVLRVEKERLLPLDEAQEVLDVLMAERDQAQAAEANLFKAIQKRDIELAKYKEQLEQANADISKARAGEASMLRALNMANSTTYEAREEAGELKGELELTQKQIATLQVTNDEHKEQLKKQAEELELMQTNRVHAEVYQNVAAERDRALAELRTQERAFQKELDKQHDDLCACQTALVREQACRAELAKELQGCIADERANLATTRKELEVVSNKYDQLRVAFNKSGEEVMRLHLERAPMLREQDNAQAVIKSVEIGKAAATLLRQALNHIDRLQYSAGTKAEQ